jgi:hypothetical protein
MAFFVELFNAIMLSRRSARERLISWLPEFASSPVKILLMERARMDTVGGMECSVLPCLEKADFLCGEIVIIDKFPLISVSNIKRIRFY